MIISPFIQKKQFRAKLAKTAKEYQLVIGLWTFTR